MTDPRARRAQRTAELLLRISAVHFRPKDPFRLASGKPSPVYVDCRRIISFPDERSEIVNHLTDMITHDIDPDTPFDCLAGGETAGIPFAAFVADRMRMPMAYIRKNPKGYGRNARIEGVIAPRCEVLLMEDLATDGGSKLRFAEAVREAGAECRHTAVILGYGIFPEEERALEATGLKLHRLCSLLDVCEAAKAMNLLGKDDHGAVREFVNGPREWQARNAFKD